MRWGRPHVVLGLILLAAGPGGCHGCGESSGEPAPLGDGTSTDEPQLDAGAQADGEGHVIVAAGDIACAGCKHRETAALIGALSRAQRLAAILPLGDEAYPRGALSDFMANYAPSWGTPELLALTHPVPGNHEYARSNGDGYFDYFNGVGQATGIAGARGQGYYSFDIGSWHLIALNSNDACHAVSCDAGSPQQTWLAADSRSPPDRLLARVLAQPSIPGRDGGDGRRRAALGDVPRPRW